MTAEKTSHDSSRPAGLDGRLNLSWQPPGVEEFNGWPNATIQQTLIHSAWPENTVRRWLIQRLQENIIYAVGRTGRTQISASVESFVPIPPFLWKLWPDDGEHYFWKTGDARFVLIHEDPEPGMGNKAPILLFTDVRIDPAFFDGKVHSYPLPTDQVGRPLVDASAKRVDRNAGSEKGAITSAAGSMRVPLGATQMERVARLIHGIWGMAITEDRAFAMAKAVFPDSHISRDKFRPIYRAIRGPKSRGKQPLSG